MDGFTFFNPTKVDFGKDKERLIGQHLAEHGVKMVLLCYGSDRIARSGPLTVVFATGTHRRKPGPRLRPVSATTIPESDRRPRRPDSRSAPVR